MTRTRSTATRRRGLRLSTLRERRRLYLTARLIVKRHYAQPLTLTLLAKTLASSPRQLQRAYTQFGEQSFREDLQARRMAAATELLATTAIPVVEVARRVGYSKGSHFAQVFRATHDITPAAYRTGQHQPTPGAHPLPPGKQTRSLT
ncbi:MAG TPA: helix-turn-helix transcriptional regulator [Solirubrobacteraceae bacterium]|nr:helix-turn-helix transcriptional regulator [Solirubrobacteraceae bacterium]